MTKLTDKEIKKAFMICNNLEDGYCSECPYEDCDRCIRKVATDTLDYINRLEEEKAVLNRKLTDAYLMIDKLKGD